MPEIKAPTSVPANNSEEKDIRHVFVISLILKGISSFLEIIGGLLLLFTGSITAFFSFLIHEELLEEPTNFIAGTLRHILPYFSAHGQLFGALYLLFHGIIKIFLVINLIRNRLWAYPTAIIVLLVFVAYQTGRFAYTHSPVLAFMTLFDVLIIIMTWHEYGLMKKRLLAKQS